MSAWVKHCVDALMGRRGLHGGFITTVTLCSPHAFILRLVLQGRVKLIGGGVQAWRRLHVKMSLPYGPMLLAVILSHDATKPMIGPYHPYTAVYGSYGTEKYGSVPYTYGLSHILSDGSRYGGIPVPYVRTTV
jgi:hypothetical protein